MAVKQQQGYQIGEEVLTNLEAVATALGVNRVTKKDVSEGGKYADKVKLVDLTEEQPPAPPEEEEELDETEDDDSGSEEVEGEGYSALDGEEVTATPEEIKASMPEFKKIEELKEFIRDIDTPTLEYMVRGLKLTWKPTNNISIHRMRVAMALQAFYFPELFKPKDPKKKGKYGDLSTEELTTMAAEHKLEVPQSGNEPIDRMRLIMALKKVNALE